VQDKPLIIGYGNTLRGDDGVGPYIAQRLAERGFPAIAAHQLLPEHAEQVAAAGEVVFIDASAAIAPGEVRRSELCPGAGQSHEHSPTPQSLLAMVRDVYAAAPRALLIEIGASQFEFGAELSEAVRLSAERIIESAQGTGVL
jgi:hydrogenase maturation protease